MLLSDSRTPSLWLATAEVPAFPRLQQDLTTDVAVIGGGIVGVLTAYQLVQAGHRVALIEGRRLLHGVTGNTTAKVSASHGTIYSHLISHFSEGKAQLYAEANKRAIDWIEQSGVDCDFRRRDLYLYAEDQKAHETIEQEAEAAAKAGLECSLVGDMPVPIPDFGAVKFPNQAEFHPVKFLSTVLKTCADHGCQVFEGTMVKEVGEDDTTVLKTVDGITIRAQHVVIATHFPFFDPGFYYARLDPFRDYAISIKMDPCLEAMYVGSGEGYTYRCQGDQMIVSGASHKVGKKEDTDTIYSEMESFVREHFPNAGEVTYRWSTQDTSSIDKVPYIGKISANAENVYVACGFGGWGMTQGVIASQLLTKLIRGENPPEAELYDPLRFKPLTSASTLGTIVKDSVAGLVGKRLTKYPHIEPEDLPPGEAKVIDTDEGKVGAYRDEQGQTHVVSAVCTHMGCILAWNKAEKSWDCPCHGSRFDYDGSVLHGPAVDPLEKIKG